ncbi:ParB/RepB/Spo0J family partition protein [Acidaminobacter hydrogenoformans]|uniref:Chromosome partitioning protein, ParB family n=1 Tax=Acidaminobacter hydrogenoformans DSM 2784 TaxID=1120920 RepID=A0A1G5RS25_9FIRM|nr:ParB/RepB/Spo0J family partition protein [Acidaminobacter hydrogenoformans]SCZ76658.1 chromosome partitioning protein, ParB family [Acidaminobacter hydrogenoformans DSM 2784]
MNRSEHLIHLPIEHIRPNPHQPRRNFSYEDLNELADSIKSVGIIQPITVRVIQDGYELVVGERRLRAAGIAGLKEIPAMLVNMSDQESAAVALIENIQRNDLNFFEEACALERLMKDQQWTQKELADLLGKKQSTISNKIRLLAIPEPIRDTLIENQLSERHARALLKLDSTAQLRKAVRKIIQDKLTVKETESYIAEWTNQTDAEIKEVKSKRNIRGIAAFKIYLNTLKQSVETIKAAGGKLTYEEVEFKDGLEVRIRFQK